MTQGGRTLCYWYTKYPPGSLSASTVGGRRVCSQLPSHSVCGHSTIVAWCVRVIQQSSSSSLQTTIVGPTQVAWCVPITWLSLGRLHAGWISSAPPPGSCLILIIVLFAVCSCMFTCHLISPFLILSILVFPAAFLRRINPVTSVGVNICPSLLVWSSFQSGNTKVVG